jgi:hypothetical protein
MRGALQQWMEMELCSPTVMATVTMRETQLMMVQVNSLIQI